MKFFNDCKTIEEVKATYKKLAKHYHPNCGGDTATMQAINTEYSFACAKILKGENLTTEEAGEKIRLSEEYRKVIEQIIHISGIVIEIVGNWIWVTGNTYPVRTQLKEAGLFFASKKTAWYYRAEEFKTKGGQKSLEEIKSKYGSETVSRNAQSRSLKY